MLFAHLVVAYTQRQGHWYYCGAAAHRFRCSSAIRLSEMGDFISTGLDYAHSLPDVFGGGSLPRQTPFQSGTAMKLLTTVQTGDLPTGFFFSLRSMASMVQTTVGELGPASCASRIRVSRCRCRPPAMAARGHPGVDGSGPRSGLHSHGHSVQILATATLPLFAAIFSKPPRMRSHRNRRCRRRNNL